MKQQNILFGAITFLLLSMAIVSAVTYGYVEQDIEFKSNETVADTSSSSGGSSGNGVTIKDWSAKCGYNLECLYGKETKANETIVFEPEVKDDVIEVKDEVIKKKVPGWVWILIGIIFVMVIVGLIIYFKNSGEGEGFTG